MRRDHTPAELGLAWGLIAGAAVGSLLLALTGSALWLSIAPGIGLSLGLIAGRLVGARSHDRPSSQ